MQALFDAVDVTGISTNVSTLMIAFIGIGLLFLGYPAQPERCGNKPAAPT